MQNRNGRNPISKSWNGSDRRRKIKGRRERQIIKKSGNEKLFDWTWKLSEFPWKC